jgi:hypothetical protein
MSCEYIPKETIDWKGNLYSGSPWVYCDQKVETHSVFTWSGVLAWETCLACLVGVRYCLVQGFTQFSYDSIQTSPDESNLKLDVILACL